MINRFGRIVSHYIYGIFAHHGCEAPDLTWTVKTSTGRRPSDNWRSLFLDEGPFLPPSHNFLSLSLRTSSRAKGEVREAPRIPARPLSSLALLRPRDSRRRKRRPGNGASSSEGLRDAQREKATAWNLCSNVCMVGRSAVSASRSLLDHNHHLLLDGALRKENGRKKKIFRFDSFVGAGNDAIDQMEDSIEDSTEQRHHKMEKEILPNEMMIAGKTFFITRLFALQLLSLKVCDALLILVLSK